MTARKKLIFEAQEMGVSAMFQKLQGEADKLKGKYLEQYRSANLSAKEYIKLIDEQINTQSKLQKLSLQDKRVANLEEYKRKLKEILDWEQGQIDKIRQTKGLLGSEREEKMGDIAKVATQKRGLAKEGMEEANKKANATFEEQKITNELLRLLIKQEQTRWEQEAREDKKNIERGIVLKERQGFAGSETRERLIKGFYSRFRNEFKENREDEGVEGEDEDEGSGESEKKRGGRRRFKSLRKFAGGVLGAALSPTAALAAIPIIGGTLAYMLSQATRLQQAGVMFSGTTGMNYSAFGGNEGFLNLSTNARRIGMNRAELLEYSTNLAKTRGYAGSGFDVSGRRFREDLQTEATGLAAFEQTFGLQRGFASGLSRYQSFDTNRRGTLGDVKNLVDAFKQEGVFVGGDYSRLEELMQTQNTLTLEQTNFLESVNTDTNLQMMGVFNRIGGSFANPLTMSARMSQITGSLRNPSNDFAQAFNYATLRGMNPSASFFKLQEMQDEASPEFLRSSLSNMRRMSGGSNELFLQNIKSRFGLSAQQARTFGEAYLTQGDAMFNTDAMQNLFARNRGKTPQALMEEMLGLAEGKTPTMTRYMAELGDVGAAGGESVFTGLETSVKFLATTGKDAFEGTVNAFNKVTDSVGKLSDTLERVVDKFNFVFK